MIVQVLLDFAKDSLRMSSAIFVIEILAAGVVMLNIRRFSRAGRWWLTVWAVILLLFSMPLVSRMVTAPLARPYTSLQTRDEARGADVIVMMGGGIHTTRAEGLAVDDLNKSALRVLEVARLYRLLGPRAIIVSGGNTGKLVPPRPEARAFAAALISLGVPPDRIVVEEQSRTTREEAVILRPMLESYGATTFVLVTAPAHMRRSMKAFEAQQLTPIASPSPLLSDARPASPLIPDVDALFASDAALYEYLALAYYWIRGWM